MLHTTEPNACCGLVGHHKWENIKSGKCVAGPGFLALSTCVQCSRTIPGGWALCDPCLDRMGTPWWRRIILRRKP